MGEMEVDLHMRKLELKMRHLLADDGEKLNLVSYIARNPKISIPHRLP